MDLNPLAKRPLVPSVRLLAKRLLRCLRCCSSHSPWTPPLRRNLRGLLGGFCGEGLVSSKISQCFGIGRWEGKPTEKIIIWRLCVPKLPQQKVLGLWGYYLLFFVSEVNSPKKRNVLHLFPRFFTQARSESLDTTISTTDSEPKGLAWFACTGEAPKRGDFLVFLFYAFLVFFVFNWPSQKGLFWWIICCYLFILCFLGFLTKSKIEGKLMGRLYFCLTPRSFEWL